MECGIHILFGRWHERWSLRYRTTSTACPTNGLYLCRYVAVNVH